MLHDTVRVRLALAGVFVGAILGRAVGLGLRSDNVPFFILLGAVVGVILGAATGYFIERRQGAQHGRTRPR